MINLGINGFGRIGRLAFRAAMQRNDIKIKHINNPGMELDSLLYLLKYDSVHGTLNKDKIQKLSESKFLFNGNEIKLTKELDAKNIGWNDLDIYAVLDCSGKYLSYEKAEDHIKGGSKKLIMSAPCKDETPMFVYGVNLHEYKKSYNIVSNASCTTNCLAPVIKVLNENFGISEGLMTTVHAVTSSQKTVDGGSLKDWRGGRACFNNIIPSSTGAAKAVGRVIPEMKGKLTGMSFRVPVLNVSVVDLTFKTKKSTSYKEICEAMKESSKNELKGILGFTDEQVVSTDFITDPRSSIFDAKAGIELNSNFFKVVSWYDNEWGYSNRLLDLAKFMHDKE